MNNFLKQINILLAKLKSKDIEKFTEIFSLDANMP